MHDCIHYARHNEVLNNPVFRYNFITPEAFLRQYKDKPEKAAFGDGHTLVVVDESHLYKGLGAVQQSANDYKTARVLQKALEHANRIILMTGICLFIRVFLSLLCRYANCQ
jgi:hypothetical protein